MRLLFSLIFLFTPSYLLAQVGTVTYCPAPAWVKEYPLEKEPDVGHYSGSMELLVDVQIHVEKKARYQREVTKITDGGGVFSYYNIHYDPSFQAVQVHKVTIYRGEDTLSLMDKMRTEHLLSHKMAGDKIYKKESTIKIWIEGLRIGDIFEVSYTEIGSQPDLKDHFILSIGKEAETYVYHKVIRLLFDPQRRMKYKATNDIQKPAVSQVAGLKEWIWDWREIERVSSFHKCPDWYDMTSEILIADFENLHDVVELQLPAFEMKRPPSEAVKQKVSELIDPDEPIETQINAVLDFTQNHIHYLSNSYYEPIRPDSVLYYGYGDCKAKSLLTCKMLACLGIEGWPLLVNYHGFPIAFEDFPSPQIFDHMIVEFKHKGKNHYFDGTMDTQGGKYDEKYYHAFRKGLRVTKGSRSLVTIPVAQGYEQRIYDAVELPQGNGLGKIQRKVHFLGGEADHYRQIYEIKGVAGIQGYLDQKFDWAPGRYGSMDTEWAYEDLDKTGVNEVILSNLAYKEVASRDMEDTGYKYFRYEADPIYSFLPERHRSARQAYYSLPFPKHLVLEIRIPDPTKSSFLEETHDIKTPHFLFKKVVSYEDSAFVVLLELEMLKDHLKKDEMDGYLEKRREVIEESTLRFGVRVADMEGPGYTLGDAAQMDFMPREEDSTGTEGGQENTSPEDQSPFFTWKASLFVKIGLILLIVLGAGFLYWRGRR